MQIESPGLLLMNFQMGKISVGDEARMLWMAPQTFIGDIRWSVFMAAVRVLEKSGGRKQAMLYDVCEDKYTT